MHIQQASVSMQAQHQLQRQHQTRAIAAPPDSIVATKQSLPPASTSPPQNDTAKTDVKPEGELPDMPVDRGVLMIKRVLEAFLGKRIVVGTYQEVASSPATKSAEANPVDSDPPPAQWVHLSLHEQEVSQFTVQAEITLANGVTRKVAIEHTMARELKVELQATAGQAARFIDPLVINFGGPVQLSGERVEFDLNADGEKESIAGFASDSAYLALDRNGDGNINDGGELFGAMTGDGFAELAAFDDDGNGFIDANDAVFSQLRLFDPAKSTSQPLQASGVEAIYLDKIATPFAMKEGLEELGYVRSTGIYLTEFGAGTVQQIDLVV